MRNQAPSLSDVLSNYIDNQNDSHLQPIMTAIDAILIPADEKLIAKQKFEFDKQEEIRQQQSPNSEREIFFVSNDKRIPHFESHLLQHLKK